MCGNVYRQWLKPILSQKNDKKTNAKQNGTYIRLKAHKSK
ncbi:hypothetical protein PB1_02260 [Bacillus methanolicus PB1]|uniref:Uncharacterized protein n=1 Tax=Bacillus methanolicus PB1 TaxID=997296 RepID=I3E5F4_BACMT|nr:hypothetical protein PB1_02260 [Bacillus methanolicus PB1]